MTDPATISLRRRDIFHAAVMGIAVADPVLASPPPATPASAEGRVPPTVSVDLAKIAPGSAVTIVWRGRPVLVRSLTPEEIAAADAVSSTALRDPATLAERTKAGHRNWMIAYAVCTHLGCTLRGIDDRDNRGRYGGYACPCHGSQYDAIGRVRSGPAPVNLEIPAYRFRSSSLIVIGEE